MYTSGHPFGPPRQQRWGFISWWFTLFLIIPMLGIIGTLVYTQFFEGSKWEGVVVDAYTDEPVDGAIVELGDRREETGDDGRFDLRSLDEGTLTVSRDGYESTTYDLNPESDQDIEIPLRPNTMQGIVTHRMTEEPIGGARVEARLDDDVVSSTETSSDGSYLLTDIPEDAEIVFSYADFADVIEEIDRRPDLSITMRPAVVTGTVTDQNGDPIRATSVAIGDVWTQSNEDGTYRLENTPESGDLIFKASGYKHHRHTLDDRLMVDVTLEEKEVRAIYVTAGSVADEQRFAELVDLVDRTELNAMVIDIKDSSGFIFHDTEVELAHEIDAVRPTYDVEAILEILDAHDIYSIARQVVFEDPRLAEARTDLAIGDSEGGIWRTTNGIAWLSAYQEEVWDYNIELMMEAVELGFDEIQYDYIRFPSDGPLDRAEYSAVEESTSETRVEAITEFLRRSREEILPTPAYLAADIFGLTLWETGDGGIGQNLESVTAELDYICPMIYPSHFYPGSMGFDVPNDHPYEIILWSLENGHERIPDEKRKIRPWLQDFSYGAGRDYGPQEVRDQIEASRDFGATGWMLWNASSRYQEDALSPAE